MAVVPRPEEAVRGAGQRLRGPPGLLAQGTHLRRAGPPAGRVRAVAGLHPRGVHARGRAPLRRVVGLPRHRLLRPDLPLRLPRRVPLPGRRAAQGRHRRLGGLGARALRDRPVGVAALRRHRAVRARGPTTGLAPRLGLLHLQLRPQRGEGVLDLQRLLLAGGVPHRRAADRRRRLDALPGLLPRGRAVGAEQVRRQREPGGRRAAAAGQRAQLPAPAGHHDDRRGVHLLARGDPVGRSRRPGLRLQVEHGLDERLAALLRARADLPAVPPPRDDVRDGVRVLGELRAADQPRRGRARQGLHVRAGTAGRVAQVRHHARVLRLHVGTSGQEAAVHGHRVRPAPGVLRGPQHRLGPERALGPPWRAAADQGPERDLSGPSRVVQAGQRSGRLPLDQRRRRRRQRVLVGALRRRRADDRLHHQLLLRTAQRLPRGSARRGRLGGNPEHRCRGLRRHRHDRQPGAGDRASRAQQRIPGVGQRDHPAARRGLAAAPGGADRGVRGAGEGRGRHPGGRQAGLTQAGRQRGSGGRGAGRE